MMQTLLASAWPGPNRCTDMQKATKLQPRAKTFAGERAEAEDLRKRAMAQAVAEVPECRMRATSVEGLLLPASPTPFPQEMLQSGRPKLDGSEALPVVSVPSLANLDDSERLPVVNMPVVNVPSEIRERAQHTVLGASSISESQFPFFSGYPCDGGDSWPPPREAADVDLSPIKHQRAVSCHSVLKPRNRLVKSLPSVAMTSSVFKDRLRFGIVLVGMPYGEDLGHAGRLRPALEVVLRSAVAKVADVSESRVRVADIGEAFWSPRKHRTKSGRPHTAAAPPTAVRGGRCIRALLIVDEDKLCESGSDQHSMRALSRICSDLNADIVRTAAQFKSAEGDSMCKEIVLLLDALSEVQFA